MYRIIIMNMTQSTRSGYNPQLQIIVTNSLTRGWRLYANRGIYSMNISSVIFCTLKVHLFKEIYFLVLKNISTLIYFFIFSNYFFTHWECIRVPILTGPFNKKIIINAGTDSGVSNQHFCYFLMTKIY